MGRNGIGKSTMARTLCGLLEPVSGKICRNGRPANARERLRSSFLVMQDVNYQLFSDSVREEVLLGAAHPERCDAVLQALGLDGLADRHPMSLSGGQKQRVVVAAAMLSDKPLILLDERRAALTWAVCSRSGSFCRNGRRRARPCLSSPTMRNWPPTGVTASYAGTIRKECDPHGISPERLAGPLAEF